ncbi:MAG TPA: SDR family oxidoreductase [Kiritimatiellia bacterium]|nr:SDR family oxidoreductase [Kiritimatiellia bacterium]HMO98291.1 SDR family oxidoreductase [Kiritimatiellia bacterium]
MNQRLANKSAIITGAGQGLGRAIAESYVREGARVVICARTSAHVEEVVAELQELAGDPSRACGMPVDVSREDQVAELVAMTVKRYGGVDILVNNAGVYGPMGVIEDVNWADWVSAMNINIMGSVLMCRAVLPHMKQANRGKIIQLSGGGATNPLPNISAYAASKAAIVRFAETLAGEVRDYHIDVNCIAPGPLNTRLLDQVLEAGPEKVGDAFYRKSMEQREKGGAPLEKGADLAVYLASSESDGVTGKLISALWDPWPKFQEHMEDVAGTDVYTLRRIVPKDRGMTWDEEQR